MPLLNVEAKNHPLALRMCVIAVVTQATSIGCLFGAFSPLLTSVEARFDIGRAVSSLPISFAAIGVSLLAPLMGALVGKMSLRRLMMIGAVLTTAGFALLALTHSVWAYLLAYGVLIGPGVCMNGLVLPSTLVTRWFAHGRGRALGFVHAPMGMVVMPPIAAFVLDRYGLPAVYVLLAALMALTLLPMLFIGDFPPRTADSRGEGETADLAADPGVPTRVLIRKSGFWAMVLAMSVTVGSGGMFSAHIIPIARGWGIDAMAAASLLSVCSLSGMAGSLFFGWLGDKFGGRMALAVLSLDGMVLWALLVTNLPVPILMAIAVLINFHTACGMPVFGMAVSEQFGRATFSRAFGLGAMASLPFTVVTTPIAGAVYASTGSYLGATVGLSVCLAFAAVLVLVFAEKRPSPLLGVT